MHGRTLSALDDQVRHRALPLSWGGRWWRRLLWIWAWLIFLPAVQAPAQTRALPEPVVPTPLPLPPSFQAWKREHPVLRVGVVRDWRPIDWIDAEGRYTGVSGELVHVLAAMLQLPVRVQSFADFPSVLAAARAGEIDLLPSMARSTQREAELLFTDAYLRLPMAYIGQRGTTDFSESHDLGGRRVAVERGYAAHEYLLTRFPNVGLVEVEDTRAALRAVAEQRAEVYLGALLPAHQVIEAERIGNLQVLRQANLDLGQLHLAVPRRAAALHEALNMALRSIDPAWVDRLLAAWQPRYLALAPQQAPAIDPALRRALAARGDLRVGFDQGFGPINALGEDGEPAGFAIELFRRAADAAGLRYRLEPQRTFEQGLNGLRERRLDVMLSAVRTSARLEFANFVGPYYSAPSVLVSRLDGGWPSVASLAGRTLAIDRAHYLIPAIQREAPAVRLLEVETVETAMQTVAQGQADAMITNLEVAAALIKRRFLGQLQVSGTVEGRPSELYFAVRKDWPELAEALRLGLDAVPENERAALANTWLRTEFRAGLSWSQVLGVGGPLLVVVVMGLAVSLMFNRRLQAHVQARQAVERQLQAERDAARAATAAKADFLAEMSHEVRTPLAGLAGGLALLRGEPLSPKAAQLVEAMSRSADRLVQLLNNLLDAAKLEAHKITLHESPVVPSDLVRELIEEFRPAAQAKGLALRLQGEHAWAEPMMLDPLRMRQVLANLLSNAIKFTAEGSVTLVLEPPLPCGPQLSRLVLHVSDTGPGVDPAVRERLFERFAQAPGAGPGGTGLGLAIVRELVSLMGGSVSVDSQPGRGSVFTVSLELRQAQRLAAHTGESPAHDVDQTMSPST
ncbi:MAG: transporter substrate-binding domain-containing protein [Caldimonas sp.]|uniref:transporter substrate-binding domain-containing protein n=1 Tax=Caldimonas sp. TaxID=2838790 RepID=UPI00391C57BA